MTFWYFWLRLVQLITGRVYRNKENTETWNIHQQLADNTLNHGISNSKTRVIWLVRRRFHCQAVSDLQINKPLSLDLLIYILRWLCTFLCNSTLCYILCPKSESFSTDILWGSLKKYICCLQYLVLLTHHGSWNVERGARSAFVAGRPTRS